jgi:sugar/nucleoside kinase (ribokinase family)
MSLVVTGSIGIDTVQTPHGTAPDVLGGSAVYFAYSASLFTRVQLVGAVGRDFPETFRQTLSRRDIDLAGLETRAGSETFRWTGKYEGSMNEAETVDVQLNVLAEAAPTIPPSFKDATCVFLANTHPALQQSMAAQFTSAKLIVCDTMNLWITSEKAELTRLLSMVTGIVMNDGEARMFTGEDNLVTAGRRILGYGARFAIIKKGEHGALLVTSDDVVALPGYPTERVKDPTGAGDSFAGGMMGYLASYGDFDVKHLPRAMVCGTVTASFTIEDFSLGGIIEVSRADVDARVDEYMSMLKF